MDSLQHFLQQAFTPKRKTFKPKEQEIQQRFIYRDGLNTKTPTLKVKKKVHFELPSEKSERDNGEKHGIQVKILMTKEEAARFLSKCKEGGILEFKDVANEVVRIPKNRVDVVCSKRKDIDD